MYSSFRIYTFHLLLLTVLFTNCILVSRSELSFPSTLNEGKALKHYKKVSIKVIYIPEKDDHAYNLEEEEQENREATWTNLLVSAYEDSGLFREVVTSSDGDLKVQIKIVESQAEDRGMDYTFSRGWGFRPYREEGSFAMSTDFYNSKGELLGSVDLTEKYDYYYQVFFLFLMPFYSPGGEYERLGRFMGLKTLDRAVSEAIFTPKK
ncbi:hypothetical protein [Leptospira neocaledonica]|uniref:Uncharacterized protein n=1 Tax=Leptospira neocaledonica TaxID=2023192 RepID=A0A2M9ZUE4_9LEPT|nr:hypothetical protein [Leptospira neocaledonica]PJZ75717.1 hypothetical protein CH365_17050 [Leptospira neocaledonica]